MSEGKTDLRTDNKKKIQAYYEGEGQENQIAMIKSVSGQNMTVLQKGKREIK